MRRVEIALLCAICAVPAFAQTGTAPTYNRTDTFEPGKKYTCVPTTDHKGWDCNEAGKAVEIKPKESDAPPPTPAAEPSRTAPAEAAPSPTRAPQSSSRSTLPSYLTNAAATNPPPVEEPPSTVSAAAAHANAPAPTRSPVESAPPKPVVSAPANPPPAETTKTVPLKPATPHADVAAPSPRPTKPPLPPRVTRPPVVEAASNGGEFMSLPGDHFVIEMARASGKTELDAVKSSTHVPTGDLYEIHLRQNGADSWLLLWGSFDTIEAARAARNTISASAAPGWPRRIAPLQAEARRNSP